MSKLTGQQLQDISASIARVTKSKAILENGTLPVDSSTAGATATPMAENTFAERFIKAAEAWMAARPPIFNATAATANGAPASPATTPENSKPQNKTITTITTKNDRDGNKTQTSTTRTIPMA